MFHRRPGPPAVSGRRRRCPLREDREEVGLPIGVGVRGCLRGDETERLRLPTRLVQGASHEIGDAGGTWQRLATGPE